ncbi:ATP-binding cassette domain-containing protein [Agrobacterium vitis]|uniref:ABC transporter ATP-binding protein n=1 Tax=Agrobacterium vitis TaxID=373 RepID=A0A368NNA8_AGRVI|nr:ABC transporter ATP-binding protein [Agrobacterium vitis]KAA3506291.1 ABC transporter ATP-binding protein [Agrobacterium vitis]KAA3520707.1 ABC transporter ATP-binding protein [Agrobacterium vitis]MCF1480260.1 ABC transporter ATP-binding protein [Agrobacterium vitis]MUZ99621.1 ATP-binding cassette domain-containing protein [Agrobacterium vitis]MVA32393.1 ATP-binding cassette domain-containing protein [Agrobacterium vitis]
MTSNPALSPACELMPVPLELRGITVRFGEFVANNDISFSVGRGEIHALLGENGAGKSTLMRVVAGLQQPQAGEIRVNGEIVHLHSPLDAMALGIGMVHQHFMLVPTLSVAQNVCLGLTRAGRIFPNLRKVAADLAEISRSYRLDVNPYAMVGDLSVAGRQRVEIVKALYRGARILVLDEPTAVLAPQEVDGLFDVLQKLAQAGTAIVFISHKLHEVMKISDRVTILRHGRSIACLDKQETSIAELSRLMIGGDIELPTVEVSKGRAGDECLRVDHLVYRNEQDSLRLDDISFSIRAGEIVGFAGVDGNGQQELAETIVGLIKPQQGTISIHGVDVSNASPGVRIDNGLAHIPEDRHHTALVDLPIRDNAILEVSGRRPFSRFGLMQAKAAAAFARQLIKHYDVRCTGPSQNILTLSGGNQQKVVLGRALMREPELIVAVQPSRGLDIGATAFVHRQLLAQRERGAAIMLISTELDEILALSDRIMVLFNGRIVGSLSRETVTVERLGALMLGGQE